MKSIQYYLFAACLLISFNACQDSFVASSASLNEEVVAYIPEDAGMVMSMNLQNLMDKAGFDDIKDMKFYQDMLDEVKENKPELVYVFEDPTNSGIDLAKNAYLYMDSGEDGDFGNAFGGLMLSIDDKKQFDDMIAKGSPEITKSSGFSYVEIENDTYFAWNDEIAFIGGGSRVEDPTAALSKVFNKKDNSIASNRSFKSAQSGKHDFSMWMNTKDLGEQLYEENPEMFGLAEISKDAITNNTFHSYLDFEDGEIVATSEYDLSKELLQELKIIFKKEVKTDFSPYLPNEDLTMLVTGGVDFRGLNQLMKERAGTSVLDMGFKEMGVDRSEFVKAFDGDAVLALYGGDIDKPKGVLGLKIGDQKAFDNLMKNAEEQELFENLGGGMFSLFEMNGNEAKFMIKDGIVFISNHSDLLTELASGKLKKRDRIPSDKMDGITGGFMGLFMDLASVSKTMGDDMNFDAVESVTSSANWTTSKSIIKMKDDNKNALRQLMEQVDKQYQDNK